jgi:hypothetical protein
MNPLLPPCGASSSLRFNEYGSSSDKASAVDLLSPSELLSVIDNESS